MVMAQGPVVLQSFPFLMLNVYLTKENIEKSKLFASWVGLQILFYFKKIGEFYWDFYLVIKDISEQKMNVDFQGIPQRTYTCDHCLELLSTSPCNSCRSSFNVGTYITIYIVHNTFFSFFVVA